MKGKKSTDILQKNIWIIFYLFFLNLLLLFPFLLEPVFKGIFTDYVLTEGKEEWLLPLLIFMVGTALLSGMIKWLKENCMLRLSDRIEISEAGRYMWLLLHSPLSFFDKNENSRLLLKSSQIRKLPQDFIKDFLDFLFSGAGAVFYLLMMLRMDKTMSAVVAGLIFFHYLMKKVKEFFEHRLHKEEESEQELDQLVMEEERISMMGLKNVEAFKSTASEAFFFRRLLGAKMKVINAKRKEDFGDAVSPLDGLTEVLFMNLLLLVSAFRIMDHSFSIGTYLVFQAYAIAFFSSFSEVLGSGGLFSDFKVSFKELYEDLETDNGGKKNQMFPAKPSCRLRGDIEFTNVSFGYDKNLPIIKQFNLSVKSGQRIAILGGSGAGKSTLLKLLLGLYEPDSGTISIDGISPVQMNKDTFLYSIGCANQEISLFSASIQENITMWDEEISEERLYKAANDACLHGDIALLDGAYDFLLTENGSNLSGGQKQRLEITRALLYDPSIVLLDEATSSIDPVNRAMIEENLMKRGCTCIEVTHVLARMERYDEIIILDQGIVKARGTHEELMEKSEYYASLFECR